VCDLRLPIQHHLAVLVDEIGARPPGSPANRWATEHAKITLSAAGLTVREDGFTTRWWEPGTGWLEVDGRRIEVAPNPYSPAGDVHGRAVLASRVVALEALEPADDAILVLTGELAREQLMPAVFPFLDLPEHTRVRAALHRLAPAAVIAVSDHWEPILEDPDLAFPSTTISSELGRTLRAGDPLRLAVCGAVHAGDGVNVSALVGGADRRLVLCAHLDSKATTPGAFDNAASVALLLALAEAGHLNGLPVELVLFNGEDHVDACGEVAWLGATDLREIAGVVNVDGVGLAGLGTSLTHLSCPARLTARLAAWVEVRPGWVPTEPWMESDHAIFAMQGIPAVAITSEDVHALLGGLAHTPADTREVLDLDVLDSVAAALPSLLALLSSELI
jgi:aminopeptidase YwaD